MRVSPAPAHPRPGRLDAGGHVLAGQQVAPLGLEVGVHAHRAGIVVERLAHQKHAGRHFLVAVGILNFEQDFLADLHLGYVFLKHL